MTAEDIIKSYFEALLKRQDSRFYYAHLIESVQVQHPNLSVENVGTIVMELRVKGEIAWAESDEAQGIYEAVDPKQRQATMFGAPSNGEKQKKKPFTKKQKTAALEDLGKVQPMTPALERLHEWLHGQVYG